MTSLQLHLLNQPSSYMAVCDTSKKSSHSHLGTPFHRGWRSFLWLEKLLKSVRISWKTLTTWTDSYHSLCLQRTSSQLRTTTSVVWSTTAYTSPNLTHWSPRSGSICLPSTARDNSRSTSLTSTRSSSTASSTTTANSTMQGWISIFSSRAPGRDKTIHPMHTDREIYSTTRRSLGCSRTSKTKQLAFSSTITSPASPMKYAGR